MGQMNQQQSRPVLQNRGNTRNSLIIYSTYTPTPMDRLFERHEAWMKRNIWPVLAAIVVVLGASMFWPR